MCRAAPPKLLLACNARAFSWRLHPEQLISIVSIFCLTALALLPASQRFHRVSSRSFFQLHSDASQVLRRILVRCCYNCGSLTAICVLCRSICWHMRCRQILHKWVTKMGDISSWLRYAQFGIFVVVCNLLLQMLSLHEMF